MDFIVSSTALLERLQAIGRVLSTKNTMPILDNYLFEVKGDVLTVRATDLETTLISSLEIDNPTADGSIAIPSKILTDTLKELPEQPLRVSVDFDTYNIEIVSENGKFTVVGMEADEYPTPKDIDPNKSVKIQVKSNILLNGINKTIFATADDDLRPVMEGIFMDIKKESITFVSSDAHKLVRYQRTDFESVKESSFILHKKPANYLKGILGKTADDIEVEFDNKLAIFTTQNYIMICNLLEGTYPNYASVIPATSSRKMVVDRVDMLNSLKRVSIFANQGSYLVRCDIKEDTMQISGQDIDFAISAFERISCQYEGDGDFTIGFKAPSLIEILSANTTTDVVFEMEMPNRAVVILPFHSEYEYEDLLMLVMPLIVDEDRSYRYNDDDDDEDNNDDDDKDDDDDDEK